jgi:plasmid replication initiation protein
MTQKHPPTVAKSNQLVRATQRLTLTELRLLSLVLSKLKPNQIEYEIPVQEYMQTYNINQSTAYEALADAAVSMFNRVFSIPNNNGILQTRFLQSIQYWSDQSRITLKFSDDVIEHIFDLKSHFTAYELAKIVEIKSSHAFRLYEIAKSFLSVSGFSLSVVELIDQLGLNQTMTQGNIQTWVIKPALKTINDKTDIELSYATSKTGKRVTGFTFRVIAKKTAPTSKAIKKIDSRATADRLAAPQAWKVG